MTKLNLRHLGYFRAVAHEGNLTRAAEKLGLSQSALSVQIRSLENRLGKSLFDRAGRSLKLTEAGRIALDRADSIFATGDELVATLKDAAAARATLRVGALSTLSRNFQLAFVRPLLERKDVRLVLSSAGGAELLDDLRMLNLDVVLLDRLPAAVSGPGLVAHKVARQRVELFGTPRRLREGGNLPQLLARHPLIVPGPSSGVRAEFEALVSRLNIETRTIAEADDMAMMRLLARQDIGLAVLPAIVVKDEVRTGTLVRAAPLPGIVETFYAVTAPRRFPNPLIAPLLRARKREFES